VGSVLSCVRVFAVFPAGHSSEIRGFSQAIRGAPESEGAACGDMGVDHRGSDVGVAEEFLNGPDVCSRLE
jgi:hypothetical protein